MRRLLALFAIAGVLVVSRARAEEEAPADLDALKIDIGRRAPPPAEADTYRLVIHGEHQIRLQGQRSFPLVATASAQAARPGLEAQSLGQNGFVTHWLRVTPVLQLKESLSIVGQLDLTGLVVGDKARGVSADETPRDELNGFGNLQPRWLYAEYKLPFGYARLGQQPNHWGMGVVFNDGDHPTLFGDYRYGSISERLLLATKPGGKDSDFNLSFAADLVFRDQLARLTRGEQALQGIVAAYWEHGADRLGVFTTFRHQTSDRAAAAPFATFKDELDQITIDLHGRVTKQVPGDRRAFLYAEAEAAYVIGSTDLARSAAQATTQIRAYGGAAKLGVMHLHRGAQEGWTLPRDPRRAPDGPAYGDLIGELEIGYASGDADPYDGTLKRFTFDPNHRVGLLLFDEVLRFQTARSATAAADPSLASSSRVVPGAPADLLPSNGGVFGAQYVNPTVTYRPRGWLDFKGGVVVAQATSEIVDPYQVATRGSYVSYRGGSPKRRDLGVELDGGFEVRVPLEYGITTQVGAQAGVLFPGGALEDAAGNTISTQWIAVGRLGLQF
ncbi:MAG: hypothetical protein KIT84_35620 [Labilithrix sp.]|nr:hypothetical protein [Labilithrix sp.]MCW5816382.1 hypothetical protein [Labilithrix sp.]